MSNNAMSIETDLDWLARNVHVWPAGDHQPWCYVYWKGGYRAVSGNCITVIQPCVRVEMSQWLARRAELQNKPSWAHAPEWAVYMAQSPNGHWEFFAVKPRAEGWWRHPIGERSSANNASIRGTILGDWRDTLENRPSDLSEQMVISRLQEATDNVLAAAPELMTDKYKFEPFVSVEDAATTKQPAPKGSGSPILGMVLADLTNRALEGKEKYGEPLLAHNGRNPLWDAYQEALDLAMYLRQAIEELG